MYFTHVYDPADAMTLEAGGRTVSSLLLQSYILKLHGSELAMGYIAGAGTRKASRGNGYMAQLLQITLARAAERGMSLVSLIPAHAWLYDYYERFGFAPVVLCDAQRFTALHAFGTADGFIAVDDPYAPDVWEAFHRMESERACAVIHTKKQYLNILDDLSLSSGRFEAVRDSSGAVAAMAWAVADASLGRVVVKDLLAATPEAAEAVLALMRASYGEQPFSVLMPPESAAGSHRRLMRRGMMRITRPDDVLGALARERPDITVTLRLTDHLLPDNSGYYVMHDGIVTRPSAIAGSPDFDVDPDVLARLVFSSPSTGSVLGLPSVRPHMALMLD